MKKYRDYYFLKAKSENYPARSIYKLEEIDNKFKILRPGLKILDLGAAPGSWSLGAVKRIGPDGKIIACDLKMPEQVFPPQINFFQEDIFTPSQNFLEAIASLGMFDLIMSDMAPATSGNKFTDQARSYDLAYAAYEFAVKYLAPKGNFIVKIFMGPDVEQLLKEMRAVFKSAKTFKPKSSRPESKETFLIGLERLTNPAISL